MPFNFLSLAPEIRNRIYDLALLPYENKIYVCHNERFPKEHYKDHYKLLMTSKHRNHFRNSFKPNFALFFLNRQISEEAQGYFWTNALFAFRTLGDYRAYHTGTTYPMRIQKACRERVQKMEFYHAQQLYKVEDRLREMLKDCAQWSQGNLKEVTLRVHRIDVLAEERNHQLDGACDYTDYGDILSMMEVRKEGLFKTVLFVALPMLEPITVMDDGVDSDDTIGRFRQHDIKATIRDLHMAWGGKVLVENHCADRDGFRLAPLLVWDNGLVHEKAEEVISSVIFGGLHQYCVAAQKAWNTWHAEHPEWI